jgi:hypothetical protein
VDAVETAAAGARSDVDLELDALVIHQRSSISGHPSAVIIPLTFRHDEIEG